jgi:Rrf2 family protein
MIKLNRTTEYGLIALRHMSRKRTADPQGMTSAREIASFYGLPFEITAKTLQRLKDLRLIQSAHGARGGYSLSCSLKEISLAAFLEFMEGPQSVVICATEETGHSFGAGCEYGSRCELKHLMNQLNSRIVKFLTTISLAELADCPVATFLPLALKREGLKREENVRNENFNKDLNKDLNKDFKEEGLFR